MDFDELEIKIIKAFQNNKSPLNLEKLSELVNEKKDLVLKSSYYLKNKGLLDIKEIKETKEFIELKEKELPEEKLFKLLKEKKVLNFKDLKGFEGLNVAIGELKEQGVIEIKEGKIILKKEEFSSKVRELLNKKIEELNESEKKYLKKRGLLKQKEVVSFIITPKEKLFSIKVEDLKVKYNKLTKELIKKGEWKKLKKYDVKAFVEPIYGGRENHLIKFIKKIREIWVSLGFEEKKSDYIVSSLMNFDVLMVPHDHLAREAQDTFYLEVNSDYYKKELQKFLNELLEKTKEQHLKLYEYFNKKESEKFLLRTQDTVVSALTLFEIKKDLEKNPKKEIKGKYFSIGKVFRNETVDRTHLAEFHQSEGLVIGKNLKLEHLKWYLKVFFQKLGFEEIKFKIAYFPFTEPSLEVFVYYEDLGKFIELGGAGIFRKEINEIFNIPKEYNILAWGLGIERLAMLYYKVDDIRKLTGNKTSIELIRNYVFI